VPTAPLPSTSVLFSLSQADSPLRPFSTPRPLIFQPPTLISAGLSPQVLIQVIPASSLLITSWHWFISLPKTPAANPSLVLFARSKSDGYYFGGKLLDRARMENYGLIRERMIAGRTYQLLRSLCYKVECKGLVQISLPVLFSCCLCSQ
jgi:hypothetical protein